MNIFVVYAHPEPKSFNGAMFHRAVDVLAQAGHQVQQSDLYALAFNPVSDRSNFTGMANSGYFKQQQEELYATETNGFAEDVLAEQQKVLACDLMIWQFPLWWFSVPAILKGWVDRVFAMGKIYGQGKVYENGVFTGKKALLSLTTGGPSEDYVPDGLNGDLAGLLKPIHRGIFEFTGLSVLQPHVVYGPARLTPEEREKELERWEQRLLHIGTESAITVGRYM